MNPPTESYTPDLSPSLLSAEPPRWSAPAALLTPPQGLPEAERPVPDAPLPATPRRDHAREPWEMQAPPQAAMSRGQIVFILIAVAMIAICASTVVAVIVGKSVFASNTAPVQR
jgi:hypothetical protein